MPCSVRTASYACAGGKEGKGEWEYRGRDTRAAVVWRRRQTLCQNSAKRAENARRIAHLEQAKQRDLSTVAIFGHGDFFRVVQDILDDLRGETGSAHFSTELWRELTWTQSSE